MGHYFTTYFSPQESPAGYVIGFLDRCEVFADIAIYALTHDDIADALIKAHERGVKIRILTDKLQASSQYADDDKLEAAGIEVRRDIRTGSMHHKFVIGDGTAVGLGSFNWSVNADTKNMENWNVCRLKYVVKEYQEEFDRLWEWNSSE